MKISNKSIPFCRSLVGFAALMFGLVFSAFGLSSDDFEPPTAVRIYTFTSFTSLSQYDTTYTSVSCYGSPYSVYLNKPFGIAFNSSGSINIPSFQGVLTNSSYDVKYPIRAVDLSSGRAVHLSPFLFDDLRGLFVSLVNLYNSGYRGPGVVNVSSSSTIAAVNFDYRTIVSDVLSSTNATYRQIILSHLSSIHASVQNIEVNLNGLQSTIQQGNDDIVDALIGDYPELQEELRKGNSRAFDVRSSIKSQLQAWRNQATKQLDDWKADLKQDIHDWRYSDAAGYLNIKTSIDDNFSYSPLGQTDKLPFTSFVTNFVTAVVTNAVRQSSADIQSNATANAHSQIDNSTGIWDDFRELAFGYGEGLNVRIVNPTDGDNHVLVKDDAVLRVLEDGVTFVSPELTQISDAWDSFLSSYSPTNSLDWQPWFDKWVPFSYVVTNYYAEFNKSAPASEVAADFLERGFDVDRYSDLPWFERVEVLLAMIADVRSNSVEVADIQEDMERQVDNFHSLSTNIVDVSGDVVGLFGYVRRFSTSLQSVFGDSAAPLTGDYVLLSSGRWIGDEPLVLRVNPDIQNLCRLIMQCIWYLGFLVLLWVVVNWCWQKVVAVLRWLWSMFDV